MTKLTVEWLCVKNVCFSTFYVWSFFIVMVRYDIAGEYALPIGFLQDGNHLFSKQQKQTSVELHNAILYRQAYLYIIFLKKWLCFKIRNSSTSFKFMKLHSKFGGFAPCSLSLAKPRRLRIANAIHSNALFGNLHLNVRQPMVLRYFPKHKRYRIRQIGQLTFAISGPFAQWSRNYNPFP